MMSSVYSATSSVRNSALTNGNHNANGLGGSGDAHASSDDEEENLRNPDLESTVTLVGKVKDRPVFILDDMIDKSASWIAAAETVVKRGGATTVYCFATHGCATISFLPLPLLISRELLLTIPACLAAMLSRKWKNAVA